MRKVVAILTLLCGACGDDAAGTRDSGVFTPPDAPEFAPMLTSFVGTPSQLPAGVPTNVTWTWTYLNEPTFPAPTCSIDNGVGSVTKGQMTMVTINAVTIFRLTCLNSQGMSQREVVFGVPPVAPILATFTATPAAPLTANAAGNIAFAWTYSNMPSPLPTCTVDGGIGVVTSGASMSVTLPQARIFRLRCTNAQGTTFRDATVVPVNDCGVTSQCDVNAACSETAESYTCTCNNGYVGDGDVCSLVVSDCTGMPAQCDSNATCIGGTQCACNIGYVGAGGPGQCTRAKLAFVSSTTGTGNLSTWSGATGVGLAAADSVCAARASAASLPGTYVAWMSDSTHDAYCRVQGLSGKRVNNCGLGALPSAGGPWVRVEPNGVPRKAFAPTIDKLTGANRLLYYPAIYNESGTEITSATARVWTGTDENGVYATNACSDWSSTAFQGVQGFVHGGSTTWTKPNTLGTSDPLCSGSAALRCMETSPSPGPALPPRHPAGVKRAFVTSVSGNGNLSMWPDANVTTGITAADQICQARARYAGYTNAAAFKAFMSTQSSLQEINDRIVNTGYPYVRPDGIVLGTSRSELLDGKLSAAWNQTETGAYLQANAETGAVWTGSYYYGSYRSGYNCSSWSQLSSSYYAIVGQHDMLDTNAIGGSSGSFYYQYCDQTARLYCVED